MKFLFLFQLLLSALPLVSAQKGDNVVVFSTCSVSDKGLFLQSFAKLAELYSEELPGVEAWSVMEAGPGNNSVAIVEAYGSSDDFGPHIESGGAIFASMVNQFQDCNIEAWGGWSEAMKEHYYTIPGSRLFHGDQNGYIDFCRDGASIEHNSPNVLFFQGRRTRDTELNTNVLKDFGEFYSENISGVIAWITAINPDQPDVVHDMQLFRDVYAFIDHANPAVVPVAEWGPQLYASWTEPLDYNGTFVGYHRTSQLIQDEYSRNGFPGVKRVDFFPDGTMGFMKFCATPGGNKTVESAQPAGGPHCGISVERNVVKDSGVSGIWSMTSGAASIGSYGTIMVNVICFFVL